MKTRIEGILLMTLGMIDNQNKRGGEKVKLRNTLNVHRF